VRGVVEAPVKGNFGDALGLQPVITKIGPASLQTLRPNPIGHGGSLIRKDAMHMADRYSQSGGDVNGTQRRVRKVRLDVVCDSRGEFQAMRTRMRGLMPADTRLQDSQITFHGGDAFRRPQAFRLFEQRTGEMEQNGAKAGVPGNSFGKREFAEVQLTFDQALRHSKVQSRAIAGAVRRPWNRRINQCCIAFSENGDASILAIAAQSLELRDDNARPVLQTCIGHRILVKRQRAGREKGHVQVSQFAPRNRAVKWKLSWKLEVAGSANLFGIPQPGFLPVGNRDMVGGK
jgi:hypothetical protein